MNSLKQLGSIYVELFIMMNLVLGSIYVELFIMMNLVFPLVCFL